MSLFLWAPTTHTLLPLPGVPTSRSFDPHTRMHRCFVPALSLGRSPAASLASPSLYTYPSACVSSPTPSSGSLFHFPPRTDGTPSSPTVSSGPLVCGPDPHCILRPDLSPLPRVCRLVYLLIDFVPTHVFVERHSVWVVAWYSQIVTVPL